MPSVQLSPLLQQALLANQDDNHARAMELFQQAKMEEPSSPWARFLLGAQFAQAGRYIEAEEEYSAAVLLAPQLWVARYELGTLQFAAGRIGSALLTWQPLLSLQEEKYLPLFVAGYMALAQDHFSEAISQFTNGVALNTGNAALNANIQLLIDQIRLTTADAPAVIAPEAEETLTEHFLISGYGRNLH